MKYTYSQFCEKVCIVCFEKWKSLSKVIEGEVFQRLKKFLYPNLDFPDVLIPTGICAKIRKKFFLADKGDLTKETLPKAKDFSCLK